MQQVIVSKNTPATKALLLSLLLLLGGISGCNGGAPPESITGQPDGYYRVKQGDTLYSIAFTHGLDYKELAKVNGIGKPFVIYVDQLLRLSRKVAPAVDSGPGQPAKKPPTPTKAKTKAKQPAASSRSAAANSLQDALTFVWPVRGKVIRRYSLKQPVNKGIDIAGRRGQEVVAAADGVVVYAGGNLRGHGKLVIIKHNDAYLTAYGNNKTLLVEENDKVIKGAAIAKVGKNASGQALLHFEIRRNGRPEDPLKYLKKR